LLNRALKQYELFGGSLGTLSDPQLVLNKLKTRLTGDNKKEMAGLKGSLVDPRLKINLLPDTLAASATARARNRPDLRQFEIVKSGNGAIRRFVLEDALAKMDYGTESRAGF